MNEQVDDSVLAKFFGQSWRTTIGGAMVLAGGVLAASTTGKWQLAGQIMAAVGGGWIGLSARDKGVSTAQMDAAADAKTDAAQVAVFKAELAAKTPETLPKLKVEP